MRYAIARTRREQDDEAYRIYVTDALRTISENTAKTSHGSYIKERYSEWLRPKPVDRRSGKEIAADIIKRAGLEVK